MEIFDTDTSRLFVLVDNSKPWQDRVEYSCYVRDSVQFHYDLLCELEPERIKDIEIIIYG